MSGGSLPRTGLGVVAIGGAAGYTLPIPFALAIAGAALVLAGAVVIRLTFRRKQLVGQ